MTRLPNATSAAGVSRPTHYLREILARHDMRNCGDFPHDEVVRWPRGILEFLLNLGLIREGPPLHEVVVTDCPEQEAVEPWWQIDERTGKKVAIVICETCGCVHRITPEQARCWESDFAGIARTVAAAVTGAEIQIVVPDRIAYIGGLTQEKVYREIFVARGLRWNDAAQVLGQAQRLHASPAPAVLVMDKLPEPAFWRDLKPAVAVLTEISVVEGEKVVINLDAAFMQAIKPHPKAPGTQWLTVTEAAKLLEKDLLGITLKQAKARVSIAVQREAFRTNGLTRSERRIEGESFAQWRLQQRDRDLDDSDRGQ